MWFIFVYSLILMYLPPFPIHLHRKKCDIIALGILSSEEVCPTLSLYVSQENMYRRMPYICIFILINIDLFYPAICGLIISGDRHPLIKVSLYIRKNVLNMSFHFHFTPFFYKFTIFIDKECRTLDSHVLFSKVLF